MWNTARPAKPDPEANPNELEPSIRLKTPSLTEARLDAAARLRRKPRIIQDSSERLAASG
jgi:hypothetical protein